MSASGSIIGPRETLTNAAPGLNQIQFAFPNHPPCSRRQRCDTDNDIALRQQIVQRGL